MTHPLSGSLLGTAAGDAYGLPYEGLSPCRIGKCFVPRRYALIPLLHGGMVSDDTEHAVMAAQAWIDGAGDPEIFRRSLRGRLKWWFARLPAGIGLATLRSCLKMWLGLGRTGVYSAGNGPAMRASVLGVLCDDLDGLCRMVKISTELTHTDPKAYRGALAVALLAWYETHHPSWTTEAITKPLITSSKGNPIHDPSPPPASPARIRPLAWHEPALRRAHPAVAPFRPRPEPRPAYPRRLLEYRQRRTNPRRAARYRLGGGVGIAV